MDTVNYYEDIPGRTYPLDSKRPSRPSRKALQRREISIAHAKKTKGGNNKFGTKGREKCSDCRRLKRACEYDHPNDPCELCRSQGRQCGEKILKCQEQESANDAQDKEEGMDCERWHGGEDWLPKLRTLSGCSFAYIIDKLKEEYDRLREYEKSQDDDDYFGNDTSTIQMQAEDAGPAYSTGDTTVSFAPSARFDQGDTESHFMDNSPLWDYTSNQMHIDPHSSGAAFSSSSYRVQSGSARQPMPSLPAGPSLFTDNTPSSPSIDPKLLNGNEPQNAFVSLTSPSTYFHYQSRQPIQSFNMNPTQSWNHRSY